MELTLEDRLLDSQGKENSKLGEIYKLKNFSKLKLEMEKAIKDHFAFNKKNLDSPKFDGKVDDRVRNWVKTHNSSFSVCEMLVIWTFAIEITKERLGPKYFKDEWRGLDSQSLKYFFSSKLTRVAESIIKNAQFNLSAGSYRSFVDVTRAFEFMIDVFAKDNEGAVDHGYLKQLKDILIDTLVAHCTGRLNFEAIKSKSVKKFYREINK